MPIEEQQLPPPPPKRGFFGKQQPPEMPDLTGITSEINSLSRRLRLLEESSANLRRFMQSTEENIISRGKHYNAELKTANSDISEIRKELQEIREKLLLVIKELPSVARREEVKVLEKYINLWNPIKFVSQNEIDGIINEILDKREKQKSQEKQE